MNSKRQEEKRQGYPPAYAHRSIPWGLAEANSDVSSDVSRRRSDAPLGAIPSLPASGVTVPEADAVLPEMREASCLSFASWAGGGYVTGRLGGNQKVASLWHLKRAADGLVWNTCQTPSSKETGKAGLHLKDSEISLASKQTSGDGQQGHQLESKPQSLVLQIGLG